MVTAVRVIAAMVVAGTLAGCRGGAGTGPARVVERAGAAMGSDLRLTAFTADERTAGTAFDEVFAEFERLDALLSVWRDGSDVLRINAAAGDHPVPVSADTRAIHVAVTDAGPGIPRRHWQRLFTQMPGMAERTDSRQGLGVNLFTHVQQCHPLHDVAQFPHVPRPPIVA